jgi:LysR family transcriptional regulator, transcriptional activator of the cysJI operon
MHIETFRTFRDLVDTGSFSKAAGRNLISQSAVSQQLKALESRYRCRLVERGTRRGVALTDDGRVFYAECRRLLECFDGLEARLRERSTAIAGTIRLATVYSVGLHALPPYITRFMQQQPQVNVHLEYSRTNRICDGCVNDTLDFGIVACPLPRAAVTARPWREETLVLVCAPGHPLAAAKAPAALRRRAGGDGARRRVSLQQLQGEPFVVFERDIPTRKTVDRILRAHRVAVRVVMEFDNIETIKRCVGVGNGISILPESTVVNEVAAGQLVSVELAEGPFVRQLAIVHRRGRVPTPAAREFLRLLAAP